MGGFSRVRRGFGRVPGGLRAGFWGLTAGFGGFDRGSVSAVRLFVFKYFLGSNAQICVWLA